MEHRPNLLLSQHARNHNLAVPAWLLVFLLIWTSALAMLERVQRLPPTPITATTCIDDKFRFLHGTDLSEVTLLAVGSSVTWRNLNVEMLHRHYGARVKPINAAPCYLHVNQIAFLADFYLQHMPRVTTVMSVFAMRDFSRCGSEPTEFFDAKEAGEYIFQRRNLWHLYFKNFRADEFLKYVLNPPNLQEMDRYGWWPVYWHPDPLADVTVDKTCFAHLRRLSDTLAARGVDFIVMLIPPMPTWLNHFDRDGRRDQAYRAAVSAHIHPEHTVLIDTAHGLRLGDDDFADPAHIKGTSVPILMRYLLHKLDQREIQRSLYLTGTRSDL